MHVCQEFQSRCGGDFDSKIEFKYLFIDAFVKHSDIDAVHETLSNP